MKAVQGRWTGASDKSGKTRPASGNDAIGLQGILFSLLFFSFVFFYFTHPIRIGDFWWHLNTGRWIVENMKLPSHDPFTFTSEGGGQRQSLVLRGFWLSQVIYFLIYKTFGFKGLIVFKASLFTTIFYVLFSIMRRRGLSLYVSLLAMAPLVPLLREFAEVRPQVFSFLFALLLYMSIEEMLHGLRSGEPIGRISVVSAPAFMLLWSNLHRGFIVGYAVMGVYAVIEAAKHFMNKDGLSNAAFRKFILWLSASAAFSLVNPASYRVLYLDLKELATNPSVRGIDEYLHPWEYAAYVQDFTLLIALGALATVTLIIMTLSIKRVKAADLLLYIGFLSAGIWAFRFCAFFILFSVAIASGYLAPALRRIRGTYLNPIAATAVLIIAALVTFRSYGYSAVTRGAVEKTFLPEGAAAFISAYNLPPPIFNAYEWGGYLSFMLYPKYKVFIDARALNPDAHRLYRAAKGGDRSEVFRKFSINTVVFYPIAPVGGRVPGIITSLLGDDEWNLVYLDGVSVVFVRKDAVPDIPVIGKGLLRDSLISRLEAMVGRNPKEPANYLRLEELYRQSGDGVRAGELLKISPEPTPEN